MAGGQDHRRKAARHEGAVRSRRLGDPRNIAVFRALQVGDMLCGVPALRAIRAGLPQARITLIGLRWAAAFQRRFAHYLDAFIEFPGYPGLPETAFQAENIPPFLSRVQDRNFDLVVQLHGSGSVSNTVVALFGATRIAGFFESGSYCPDPELFLPYPADSHEIRRLLQLTHFLGLPGSDESLEFPLTDDDRGELAAIEQAAWLTPGEYVCIHPGARAAARRWNAEGFAAVGDALAAAGVRVVITGSPAETDITNHVASLMKSRPINLAPDLRLSLGALGALIAGARLLVTNDTAVSHVAAALRTPSVVIFTASDPRRWAPLDRARHLSIFRAVDCRPCSHPRCPIGHPCAHGVSAVAVAAKALELLRKEAPYAA